ncbi:transposase [Microbulbifer sp. THAF38]|uniref:transposase n=1 Tax=Microbulbifer sp. THAF38 TaxID=2587856 RepID=UPI001268D0C4
MDLLHPLLDVTYKNTKIHRLVYDKAADSDPLRDSLLSRGIDLICPHRRNRKKVSRQDGRKLRRYTRRWKVKRTFAWLGNYRRLVVRWERYLSTYRAFLLYCMHVNYVKEVMKQLLGFYIIFLKLGALCKIL